jgi:Flp pilus assembly secretin CpaC
MALLCGRMKVRVPAVCVAFCLMLGFATPLAAADLVVALDEAKLLRLPDKVTTIVIGNPMIADVSLQPGGLLVITGKGFGLTNLVALDRSGAVLLEKSIEVEGPRGELVVLYRGIERETYSCTPICERRITLGDSNVYFDAVIAQAGSRNGYAQGAAPAAK